MELKNVETNLREAGYAVSLFDTADEACAYLDAQVDGKSVGFGGSVTLDQLGLYETLSRHNTVHWHWRMPADKNEAEVRAAAAAAEVYFSSVNALAESGEIVNIDNVCNRVAAILYGHEQVYLVLGENKIAPSRRILQAPSIVRATSPRRSTPNGSAARRRAPSREIAATTAKAQGASVAAFLCFGVRRQQATSKSC